MDFPKIITAGQTRASDAYTIQNLPISSLDLMEQASMAFVNAFIKDVDETKKIGVVSGCGNNGGDGFAIARLLKDKGYSVTPFLVKISETLSKDCKVNVQKLDDVININDKNPLPNFAEFDIIIDALFGSGLSRPIAGFAKTIVERINKAKAIVYAVDIPSGLFCDEVVENPIAVSADIVISFQRPKMAFFFPEYGPYIQNWKVVSIGLDEAFIQNQESRFFMLDQGVEKRVQKRKRYSHKGSYGHALLIAGAYEKMGAAVLAAKACLRSGVGLLTVKVPKCGYEIIQSSVPEAMCKVDANEKIFATVYDVAMYSSIGVGPGIGKAEETAKALNILLEKYNNPMVLDADALNVLSNRKHLIDLIPKKSILTPHVKEFDRLCGASSSSIERYQKAIDFAKEHQVIIVLKDSHTAIVNVNGNLYFNTTGNPGMATAGSGDVLTGIITSLLAQGYTSIEAALIGVYFHGKAGDYAKKKIGECGITASELIKSLRIV